MYSIQIIQREKRAIDNADLDCGSVSISNVRVSVDDTDADISMLGSMVTNATSETDPSDCIPLVSAASGDVLDIAVAIADEAEIGDTDSVDSSPEIIDLTDGYNEALQQRLQLLVKLEDDIEECTSKQLDNWVLNEGLDNDVNFFKVPDDYAPSQPKPERGVPIFNQVDNPGMWPEYSFSSNAKGAYEYHRLPSGVTPVPKNVEDKREVDGWNFHYGGWKGESTNRSGADCSNPFPKERRGKLNYKLLQKMGLTKERILQEDCFFFMQLLHPVCDPSKSGIENDPRLAYYSNIENWTAKYAATIGMYGSYGHSYQTVSVEELVQFDSCVFMSGVKGKLDGSIYRRWKPNDKAYDNDIEKAMNHSRWLEIKRTFKLCDNDLSPRRGEYWL